MLNYMLPINKFLLNSFTACSHMAWHFSPHTHTCQRELLLPRQGDFHIGCFILNQNTLQSSIKKRWIKSLLTVNIYITLHFSFIYNSVTRELRAQLSRSDFQIFMGAKSCLKILVLKHLSLKPPEEFVATFSKDRVLSKIKHPTQKWGNSLEEFQLHHKFLHQVFHSDFLISGW